MDECVMETWKDGVHSTEMEETVKLMHLYTVEKCVTGDLMAVKNRWI